MKKVEVIIERCDAGFFAQACTDAYRCDVGNTLYATRWSAKRGVRRFMKALGATNWRFAGEPETDAMAEPAVKGVNSWARWEAMDSDGSVYEYEYEPFKSETVWSASVGRYQYVRWGEYRGDWRKTLRRVNA